jgi:hypothetical protein
MTNLIFPDFIPRQHSIYEGMAGSADEKNKAMWRLMLVGHLFGMASTYAYPSQKKRLISEQVGELALLPIGWDGEGASTIDSFAIAIAKNAISFLSDAVLLPEFSPNPNGTISFYWSWPHGHAELEIGRTRFSWVVVEKRESGIPLITSCSGSADSLNRPDGLSDLARALNPVSSSPLTNPTSKISISSVWTVNPFSL